MSHIFAEKICGATLQLFAAVGGKKTFRQSFDCWHKQNLSHFSSNNKTYN